MLFLLKNINPNICDNISNLICEFAGIKEYWMRRFSNDVLDEIDQGWRLVGWGEEILPEEDWGFPARIIMPIREILPCPNCYSYGTDDCNHSDWDLVSYKEMIETKNHSSLLKHSIPWVRFKYLFQRTNYYYNFEIFYAFKRQLLSEINKEDYQIIYFNKCNKDKLKKK